MWQVIRDFFARERATLNDPTHPCHLRRKTQAGLALSGMLALGMVTAFGMPRLPAGDMPTVVVAAPVAHADLARQIAELEAQRSTYVREETLAAAESVAALLQRLSIDDRHAVRFIRTDARARQLLELRAGQAVRVTLDDTSQLLALHADVGRDPAQVQHLSIVRTGARGFRASLHTQRNDVDWSMRSGQIGRNFFTAMEHARVPPPIVSQMVKLFSGTLDFRRDARPGDRFRIIFERVQRERATVGFGRLLAVEFVNRGKRHQALWYDAGGGAGGAYYDFAGQPVRQTALQQPVDYSRISSRFGGRIHPLSRNWSHHTGVDFAAPTGTKVVASARGVVDFVGVQGAYGKLVIVRHAGAYATYYAHLSRFASALEQGAPVAQGQLLGYVGQTGGATGPHLHFEVRYKNRPVDPLRTAFADAAPLKGRQLREFNRYADNLVRRIDLIRSVQVNSMDS